MMAISFKGAHFPKDITQIPSDSYEALVGFQGRGCADGVQPDFCHSLFLEALIFQ